MLDLDDYTNQVFTKSQISEIISKNVLNLLENSQCDFTNEFNNTVKFRAHIRYGDYRIIKNYTLDNYNSYDDLPEDLSDVDWDSAKIDYQIEVD